MSGFENIKNPIDRATARQDWVDAFDEELDRIPRKAGRKKSYRPSFDEVIEMDNYSTTGEY